MTSTQEKHTSLKPLIRNHAVTIAATHAAFFSILCGYPLDSIKTRMQAYKYQNTLTCIKTTWQLEGVRGFYRGVLPLIASTTTLRAVSWNIYTNFKSKLDMEIYWKAFFAGSGTGFIMSMFGAPIEFIKVQRQLQSTDRKDIPKNLLSWIKYIYNKRGVSGFYSGYRLHAPVDVLGTGFYFMIYESIKHYGLDYGFKMDFLSLAGGGISGALSWIIVFPIDVMKSLYQKQALDKKSTLKELVRGRYEEMGLRGFYRGLSMQLIRSIPVHSINFFVYERVLNYCKNT
jgi:hypothetical protein